MQTASNSRASGRASRPKKGDPTSRPSVTGWEGHRHLRCVGRPVFRSRAAVDLALVLDMVPEVQEWVCFPGPIELEADDGDTLSHVADFFVRRTDGSFFYLDAEGCDEWHPTDDRVEYLTGSTAGLMDDATIRNARGIMSYACMDVPLESVRL